MFEIGDRVKPSGRYKFSFPASWKKLASGTATGTIAIRRSPEVFGIKWDDMIFIEKLHLTFIRKVTIDD